MLLDNYFYEYMCKYLVKRKNYNKENNQVVIFITKVYCFACCIYRLLYANWMCYKRVILLFRRLSSLD